MVEFLPLILVCHFGINDCNETNAINKVQGEMQNTPMSCLIEGQTKAASLAFVPKQNEPFYIKIKCVPR